MASKNGPTGCESRKKKRGITKFPAVSPPCATPFLFETAFTITKRLIGTLNLITP